MQIQENSPIKYNFEKNGLPNNNITSTKIKQRNLSESLETGRIKNLSEKLRQNESDKYSKIYMENKKKEQQAFIQNYYKNCGKKNNDKKFRDVCSQQILKKSSSGLNIQKPVISSGFKKMKSGKSPNVMDANINVGSSTGTNKIDKNKIKIESEKDFKGKVNELKVSKEKDKFISVKENALAILVQSK